MENTNIRLSKHAHMKLFEIKLDIGLNTLSETIEKLCLFYDAILSPKRITFNQSTCNTLDTAEKSIMITKTSLHILKEIKNKYNFKNYSHELLCMYQLYTDFNHAYTNVFTK